MSSNLVNLSAGLEVNLGTFENDINNAISLIDKFLEKADEIGEIELPSFGTQIPGGFQAQMTELLTMFKTGRGVKETSRILGEASQILGMWETWKQKPPKRMGETVHLIYSMMKDWENLTAEQSKRLFNVLQRMEKHPSTSPEQFIKMLWEKGSESRFVDVLLTRLGAKDFGFAWAPQIERGEAKIEGASKGPRMDIVMRKAGGVFEQLQVGFKEFAKARDDVMRFLFQREEAMEVFKRAGDKEFIEEKLEQLESRTRGKEGVVLDQLKSLHKLYSDVREGPITEREFRTRLDRILGTTFWILNPALAGQEEKLKREFRGRLKPEEQHLELKVLPSYFAEAVEALFQRFGIKMDKEDKKDLHRAIQGNTDKMELLTRKMDGMAEQIGQTLGIQERKYTR